MIEIFFYGLAFVLALGVVLADLRKTDKELKNCEAIDALIDEQNATINKQNAIIKRQHAIINQLQKRGNHDL